jgi:hypothetical protein
MLPLSEILMLEFERWHQSLLRLVTDAVHEASWSSQLTNQAIHVWRLRSLQQTWLQLMRCTVAVEQQLRLFE